MKCEIGPFESGRLVFEKRLESHAEEVFEQFCVKDLYDYTMREVPASKEALAAGFKSCERSTSPDGQEHWLGWIAKEKVSNWPIGLFELTIIKGEAFVAYTVFKGFWGMGYAAEGTSAMIAYTEKLFTIKRFVIEMDTRNRASAKVAEKLGFEFVKVKNNAAFLKGLVSHEFEFQKLC